MTFVGKVLVIVQVVLSLCFMAFAGAVFTVQQDWKVAYEAKVKDLESERTKVHERDEQISLLNKDLSATQAIEQDVSTYLARFPEFHDLANSPNDDNYKTQLRNLATQVQNLQTELDRVKILEQDKTKLLAAATANYDALENNFKAAADEAKDRRAEAETLKKANQNLSDVVASTQDRVFTLEDLLFNHETDARAMQVKQVSLLEQLGDARKLIRLSGINEQEALQKDEPPPIVYGKVLNTKAADRSGPEYVEISIGSHDGLAVDHELDVFRTSAAGKYLGRIKLVYVEGDRAVGTVILKSKNGVIQREDNVTTKL